MKKITATLLAMIALIYATQTNAQWNLTGNSNATATSLLGTTNSVPLRLATKNTPRLVIDTLGRVGIGTSTPINLLTVKGAGSTPAASWVAAGAPLFVGFGETAVGNADYILALASTSNNARPVFVGRRSRGTLAVPTAMANNDFIMSMLASAHDGTAFQNPATIDFFVDGTPTAGNVPARISFVTGSNSSNRAERLKIGSTGDITMNTNQLFVQKSTGNVGIGTSTPGSKLHVAGQVKITGGTPGAGKVLTSDASGLATWSSNGLLPSGTSGQTLRNNGTAWVASNAMVNTGSAVGIGEANPQGALHVSQPFNFAGVTHGGAGLNDLTVDNSGYTADSTTYYVIRIQNSGPTPNIIEVSSDSGKTFGAPIAIANPIVLANGVTASFAATGGHTFGDTWTWKVSVSYYDMLLAKDGKVGIGNTAPENTLDVKGTSRVLSGYDSINAKILIGRTKSEATIGIAGGNDSLMTGAVAGDLIVKPGSNKKFMLGNSSTPALTVNSFNFMGVGTNSPSYKLHVEHGGTTGLYVKSISSFSAIDNDAASGDAAIRFQKAGVNQWNIRNRPADNYLEIFELGGGGSRMVIQDATGFVGIGNITPTALLSVNGAANKPGGGSWTVFSDQRLKDRVNEYKDGLQELMKINPIKYHYNKESGYDTKPEYVGVIAQDLQKVAPYMVSEFTKPVEKKEPLKEDKNSSTGYESINTNELEKRTYLQVDNSAMTYMLVNAVKELKMETDSKDKTIADLQTRLTRLETILTNNNSKTIATISEQNVSFADASLSQNTPNPPVNGFTKINYSIPNGAAKAEMVITDNMGRTIKQISLNTFGKGTLNVDTKGLSSGTYNYTLLVDGKLIDTKKLILTGK